MKSCILEKWWINIILFILFGIVFFVYSTLNYQNFLTCSTDIKKQDICKTNIEKNFFDKIIPLNDAEKINTDIVLVNQSKYYDLFTKYSKFTGFAIGAIAMLIIFILYGFKFIIGLGKFKKLNVFALLVGYGLIFLLGINLIYREPRFTELVVGSIFFIGKPLMFISFWFIITIFLLFILNFLINLFSKKN